MSLRLQLMPSECLHQSDALIRDVRLEYFCMKFPLACTVFGVLKTYVFLKENHEILSLVHSEQVTLISNINPQFQ